MAPIFFRRVHVIHCDEWQRPTAPYNLKINGFCRTVRGESSGEDEEPTFYV